MIRAQCVHVICTQLCLGHSSAHVGDGSRRSEEIVKNLELCLGMWLVLLLLLLLLCPKTTVMFKFPCDRNRHQKKRTTKKVLNVETINTVVKLDIVKEVTRFALLAYLASIHRQSSHTHTHTHTQSWRLVSSLSHPLVSCSLSSFWEAQKCTTTRPVVSLPHASSTAAVINYKHSSNWVQLNLCWMRSC